MEQQLSTLSESLSSPPVLSVVHYPLWYLQTLLIVCKHVLVMNIGEILLTCD